jgi:prepilin-type N-terminal cleavage/methylation domain-containing protein
MATLKRNDAFTLIELLTVMAIIGVMMGLSISAFTSIGSGSGMRAAVMQTRTAMTQARQTTITLRKRARFTYGNTDDLRGYYYTWLTDSEELIGGTNYLPSGFIYKSVDMSGTDFVDSVEFKLDGSCNNAVGDYDSQQREFFVVEDPPTGRTNTFVIYAMTGRIKVVSNDE